MRFSLFMYGKRLSPERRRTAACAQDGASLPDDDGFEVVRGNRDRAGARVAVKTVHQRDHVVIQGRASLGGERIEGAQRRAVVGAEEIDVVLGRPVAEYRRPRIARHRRGAVAEEFALILSVAPTYRGLQAGSGRK